jgi:hypothetical protein
MSALKFANDRPDLHWGRAEQDGAPFRGKNVPLLREGEADTRLATVNDTFSQTFDLSVPEDRAGYIKVLDMITNGWAKLINRELVTLKTTRTEGNVTLETARREVYIEWVVPVKEERHAPQEFQGGPHA